MVAVVVRKVLPPTLANERFPKKKCANKSFSCGGEEDVIGR